MCLKYVRREDTVMMIREFKSIDVEGERRPWEKGERSNFGGPVDKVCKRGQLSCLLCIIICNSDVYLNTYYYDYYCFILTSGPMLADAVVRATIKNQSRNYLYQLLPYPYPALINKKANWREFHLILYYFMQNCLSFD